MKNYRYTLIIGLIVFTVSCKYRSFVKYYLPQKSTHLPRFNKWDKTVGSNNNPLRSSFDVVCYDWLVHVLPDKKAIQANMRIDFLMKQNQDTLLLDFENHLTIDSIKSSSLIKKTLRKRETLYVIFQKEINKGNKEWIQIYYHGTPVKLLSYTSVNWGKDKNNLPLINTATEGIGPHHMMPCKNLLNDEPDSCFIRLGVPKNLVGVSNGKLDRVEEINNEKIYHWAVRNPINIYNLSFNVGDYIKIEKEYLDVNSTSRILQFYVLSYNKKIADSVYNQTPKILKTLENINGSFPWWNDGFKIVETNLPHSLCMEHQSCISMTDAYTNNYKGYNITLVHEIAHEWWGNNVSAVDYGDLWLHEGFAQYSEMLFVEKQFGKQEYDFFIRFFSKQIANKRPVLKPYNVRYNNLVHDDDQDIYHKGAVFLHTIRKQLDNDSLFFSILKEVQLKYAKSNYMTNDLLMLVNKKTKIDFTTYFDVYLKGIEPPVLEFKVTKAGDVSVLEYRWKNKLPESFKMNVVFSYDNNDVTLSPNNSWQKMELPIKLRYYFDVAIFGYIKIEEIKRN